MDSSGTSTIPTDVQPVSDEDSPVDRQGGTEVLELTRAGVAGILETHTTTVRRLEGTLLHPRRGQDGVHRFDRAEVEQLAATRGARRSREVAAAGKVEATVFALFKKGTKPSDVVIELELPSARVEELHGRFQRMNGSRTFGPDVLDALKRAVWYGALPPELVEAIEDDDPDPIWMLSSKARISKMRTERRPRAPRRAARPRSTAEPLELDGDVDLEEAP